MDVSLLIGMMVLMKDRHVLLTQSVIDGVLDCGKACYPKEGIVLLRGRIVANRIFISEIEIPPLAVHGFSLSSFPLHMLPTDLSVVGTAHTHPSGVLQPSTMDLNHFYGRLMIIAAYPFKSSKNLAVFDSEGNMVEYETSEDD